MRLYVWTEVLYDYTAGMIVVLAPDLETAMELGRAEGLDSIPRDMGMVAPEVTELPGCEPLKPRIWMVHGGG